MDSCPLILTTLKKNRGIDIRRSILMIQDLFRWRTVSLSHRISTLTLPTPSPNFPHVNFDSDYKFIRCGLGGILSRAEI